MIPAEDLSRIAELLRDRDVMVLSDEIYSQIVYTGEPPVSIARLPGMIDKTVILDGFSKAYAMTGWRLGYGVMPTWLVDAVTKLMVNSNSCTASFTQRAGVSALTGPQDSVSAMVAEFRRRRDVICKGLNEIPGFRCAIPSGAFYAFANVTGTGMESKELADLLLQEGGVAGVNGGCFGEYGEGYLRFSYANSLSNIVEAIERIKRVSVRWETIATVR
jgi:aspartate/methionine/tyrosine aminotransferase